MSFLHILLMIFVHFLNVLCLNSCTSSFEWVWRRDREFWNAIKQCLCSVFFLSLSLSPVPFLSSRLSSPSLPPPSRLGGSQGVGVKPLRSAGLVALALKGLWVAGSDPGQAWPLTLTGGTHLSPWKQSNRPIGEPEPESAGIQRKGPVFIF